MSTVNLASHELAIKVVYYGPGLGGKTTTLQYIHAAMRPESRGQLISLATGSDRTLYFDFLPIRLPKLGGFKVRVALYTVPGQVHYNATRKLVLANVDGLVFVADSQRDRALANVESLDNLYDNLREQGRSIDEIPLVLQYNKRDAGDLIPVAELEETLNRGGWHSFETIATKGAGIFDALKAVTTQVLEDLRRKGTPIRASEKPARKSTSSDVTGRQGRPRQLTAKSFGELAAAVDAIQPEITTDSGRHYIARRDPTSFSSLIDDRRAASAVALAEEELAVGKWSEAVRHIDLAYRRLATQLCGEGTRDTYVMAALVAGIPSERFQRFAELVKRVESAGGVASSDALFAIFFLTDVALRLQERSGSTAPPTTKT